MEHAEAEEMGLKKCDAEKIRAVFTQYPEVENVILYGSRSKGNFKIYSDIDLTLVGEELNLTIQQKIEGELDDLLLPYEFDLSILGQIENKELIAHIERAGKLFF